MITAHLAGRLGNQMFLYALVRTVAERGGYKFYLNPDEWLGGDLLSCDLGVKDGEPTNFVIDEPDQRFRPELLDSPDFTHFYGFFQTEKYFNRDKVKEWFKLEYPQETLDFLDRYPISEYCYINVRGTDQAADDRSYLILPPEYYKKAMDMMLVFNDRLKFVIITDDIPLAKFYFPDHDVYSNDRDTDFCLFNAARYVISGISTFVWWAAYLNDDNMVIAPRGWFASQKNATEWMPKDIKTNKFIWI